MMHKGNARQEILSAAKQIFSDKGYARATTKEISNAAGVAEITVFRQFETKANLFYETILNYLINPMLNQEELDKQGNGREVILNIMEERINTLQNNRALFMTVINEAQYNDEVKNMLKKIYSKVSNVIILSLESEYKGSKTIEVENVARVLLSTIVGGIILELVSPDKELGDSYKLIEIVSSII